MDEGGAVYCSSNLIMDNATFVNNNAKKGGAVYFSNGTVTGSNFTGNSADEGGAVYCSSNLIMDNATFENNNAKKGGAVYFSNGTVTGSNFTGNHASSAGAISTSGDLTVENTVFKDNSATDGSDNIVLIGDAKLTLINVTPKDLIPSHIEVIEIVDVQNASYGGTVKITVNVTGVDGTTPLSNGTVAVVIDGKTYSAKISNGTATIAISGLNAGSYDANVTLITEGYAALSKQVKFQISKINAKITASANHTL